VGLRVLVCGSRYYTNYPKVLEQIRRLNATLVIAGACRGADLLAVKAAKACSIPYVEFPADWQKFGKAAGPIRNVRMLKEGKPDFILVFHPDIASSKGSKHMLSIVKKARVPFLIVS
jgi:hypothetical protein